MKIGALPIIFIGASVGLLGAAYGYFQHYEANMGTYNATKDAADKWEAEAKKLPAAYKKRTASKEFVQKNADDWQAVVAKRTPSASLASGGIDLGVNAFQLTVDSRTYANSLQSAINRQVKRGGVVVDYGGDPIRRPGNAASSVLADYYNYPAIPFPVVFAEIGQIRVHGTWSQIKANIEAWSSMPNYLAVASGLNLEGTGQILNATYNVSIVGYLRGKNLYPGVPEIGGGGGGGRPAGGGGAAGGGQGAALGGAKLGQAGSGG